MQLIATITPDSYDSGVTMTSFRADSGVKRTSSLSELVVTDTHIGQVKISDVRTNLTLTDFDKSWWEKTHKFLHLISTHGRFNPSLGRTPFYKLYYVPLWTTADKIADASPEESMKLWARDILGDKIYVGSSDEPYTFGAVSVVNAVVGGEHGYKFEVYSPRITNNRYNGGDKYYHRASSDMGKALKFLRKSIRAPLPEERHLPELIKMQNSQENAVTRREFEQTKLANQVTDYSRREQVVSELLSLRRYVDGGSVGEYTFASDSLSETLSDLVRENNELLEAIDYKLEKSGAYYRVHMFEHDGRVYYSRTATVSRRANLTRYHDVYADTPDAAYRPVESMPEETQRAISMLNFYDKDDSKDAWVLGLGIMLIKNELYYIPTTPNAILREQDESVGGSNG
tara:strand:+ start:5054 stop:6253 length:1200 start_codon:yes stop_codon:yes gene_type:complete